MQYLFFASLRCFHIKPFVCVFVFLCVCGGVCVCVCDLRSNLALASSHTSTSTDNDVKSSPVLTHNVLDGCHGEITHIRSVCCLYVQTTAVLSIVVMDGEGVKMLGSQPITMYFAKIHSSAATMVPFTSG